MKACCVFIIDLNGLSEIIFLPSLSFVIVPSVTPSSKACCKSFEAWILLSLTLSTPSLTLKALFLISLVLAAYSEVNLLKSDSYCVSDIKPSSSLVCNSIKSLFNFFDYQLYLLLVL